MYNVQLQMSKNGIPESSYTVFGENTGKVKALVRSGNTAADVLRAANAYSKVHWEIVTDNAVETELQASDEKHDLFSIIVRKYASALSTMSAADLIGELKRRGYSVSLEKI